MQSKGLAANTLTNINMHRKQQAAIFTLGKKVLKSTRRMTKSVSSFTNQVIAANTSLKKYKPPKN